MTDYHEIHEKHENHTVQDKIVLADESYLIQGAIFEVHKTLGCGFLEAVYQECLEIEFKNKGIPFKSQADLVIFYKGQNLKQAYKPDFICFESIIIELKAVKTLMDEHRAQTLNYLKATVTNLPCLSISGIIQKFRSRGSFYDFFAQFVLFVVKKKGIYIPCLKK